MQEVHVHVEKHLEKEAAASISPDEIIEILASSKLGDYSTRGTFEHIQIAISNFERVPNLGNMNRTDALEKARESLRNARVGVMIEEFADLLVRRIWEPRSPNAPGNPLKFPRSELYWQYLDEWRYKAVRAGEEVPFSIRRYTVYLASLNRMNLMRRRGDEARFGVHNWIDLGDQNLIRGSKGHEGIVDRNTFTYFELEATLKPELDKEKNVIYENGEILYDGIFRFTADETVKIRTPTGEKDAKFDRWEIINLEPEDNNWVYDIMAENSVAGKADRYVRSVQRGVTTHWNKVLSINVKGRIKIVAYYSAEGTIKYNQRPGIRSPYQAGSHPGVLSGDVRAANTSGPRGLASAAKNTTIGALGMSGIKDRLGRTVSQRDLKKEWEEKKKNTLVLAAANKGKRILNRYAKAEFTRIFIRGPKTLREEYRRRATELRELERAARTARNELRRLIRQEGRHRFSQYTRRTNEDLINMADDVRRERAEGGIGPLVAMNQARDTLQTYLKSREKFFEDYKRDFEAAAAHLQNYLLGKAQTISIELARRYRMGMNSDDEAALERELQGYAVELAEDFASRGRTLGNAMMRGLGIMSRGAETFSAAGMNALQSTWDFVFGPWTWTTILALVMFFFTLTYVGYNVTYLWIFPLIGAGFTFLLNFSDSFRPLDWVTHLSSGAIIGYSAMLLLVALGALNWSFMSTFVFWIVWAVLGFLGIMQFYQTGGWKTVLQGAVIILLFAYVALGPYSAYYQQALGQVKAPVEIAYRAVSSAVTDIWLLATNPTEWYARQQLVNVRPESPIDFPKGLEITLLDALPPSVPGGREFALTTVIKNEGSLQKPALDAALSFGCNQWCIVPQPDPALAQSTYSLCHDNGYIFDEYYCGTDCGEDVPDASVTGKNLDSCIQSCRDQEKGVAGAATKCLTRDRDTFLQSFGRIRKMERGEVRSVNVRGFTTVSQSGRQGETRMAEVTVNLSYRYSTSTTLSAEVMTQGEMDRKIQENENIFRNVLAVTKSSPAQLSLNVGPQPLTAGQKSILLVSVSNTREDSSIVLKRGTLINITMPKVVGTGLECEGISARDDAARGSEVLTYMVPQDVTVLPYNFQSIFAFICDFNAASEATVMDVKTALITAEMPDYTFVLTKKKQIPVTQPLGILFDPYEPTCNKCGSGTLESCDAPSECYAQNNRDGRNGTCWFEFSDVAGSNLIGGTYYNRCHSCANVKCERFVTEGDCGNQAIKCGLSCKWDPAANRPSNIDVNQYIRDGSLDPDKGACKEKVVSGVALASCSSVDSSYMTGYNKYKDKVATQLSVFPLDGVSNPQALVAALIAKESDWNERAYNPGDPSYGLMQIVPKSHPECDASKLTSYDVDENLKCGIRFLSGNIRACGGSVEGALRKYNSGSCSGTTSDPNYVGYIMGTFTDSRFSSGYAQWSSCFAPAAGKGSQDYCQQKLASTSQACDEYTGGCNNDGECKPIAAGPNPPQRLVCRSGVAGVGICCYPRDSNDICVNNFNAWVASP